MASLHKRFVELEANIKHHDYLYFVVDKPIIADSEYDILVAERNQLLEEHPEFQPNHTPGFVDGPTKLTTTPILEPFISIDKRKDVEGYETWIKKHIKGLTVHEEKLDGVGLRHIYEFGNLAISHLRGGGDGLEGTVVTHRVGLIRNVPEWVEEFQEFARVEVSGEVFCMDADRFAYCEQWDKDPNETTCRTLVGGMLKRLKPSESDTLIMYFRAYSASRNLLATMKTYTQLREKLTDWGFDIPVRIEGTQLQSLYKATEKPDFGYPIDGLVAKADDLSEWVGDKFVGNYPYAICYKFPSVSLETKLLDVIWGLSTAGVITGTVVYEPVQYDGTTMRRAKFNYMEEYINTGIRIGSIIRVAKGNEIIPQMVSLKEIGKGKKVEFPRKCPCCDQMLVRESPTVLKCVNDDCSGTFSKQMCRVVSIKGLDIKGLGEKGVEALVASGYMTTPSDLFQLKREDYMNLDTFNQNTVEEIVEQLEVVGKLPLHRWLFAACIPTMGSGSAVDFARQQNTLFTDITSMIDALKDADIMAELFGVDGLVMANYVTNNENDLFRFFVHYDFTNPIPTVGESIPIVFSGSWLIPREELKRQLAEYNYDLNDRVTKSTCKLVIAKDPSPGKISKAEKYEIPIIQVDVLTTFDALLKLLKE